MDTDLRETIERKFKTKKAQACLLQVFENAGVHSWNDLQNLPGLIGLPNICGQSVYELVEKLNKARGDTVEVKPITPSEIEETAMSGEKEAKEAEQDQPDPKPKRRSRVSDTKEINNGE